MSEIEIKDVGPISSLTIPVPEGGGVVVLRGGQGVGKTTAIKAVSKTLGAGKVRDLSTRDGAKRGVLEMGDVRLTVTKARATRKGELECAELESRLDIAGLVDPGIDDPERADVARIKALVSLAGVAADPTAYHAIVGGQEAFDQLGVDTDTDDPVLLATRVKRALEASARQQEKVKDAEQGHAAACKENFEGVDMTAPSEKGALEQAYHEAREELSRLEERRRMADKDADRVKEAESELKRLKESYDGPTSLLAREMHASLVAVVEVIKEKIAAAKKELEKLEQERTVLVVKCNAASDKREAAERHWKAIEGWERTLKRPSIEDPGDEAIAEATIAINKASEAMEEGVRIRDARLHEQRYKEHLAKAKAAEKHAEILRDAARGTDDVLSQALPSSALRVEGGRIVTETDRSKSELYAELSRGEQWILAIDLACEQLPEDGVLCIPQEAWEGIQPKNKDVIVGHAKLRKVTILTAEATDGDLEAEVYGDQ